MKDHTKDQENEAFGAFLIEAIAGPLGLPNDPKSIDKAIYRGTDCGAWVRFDSEGIMVGTIVEGSDAEYSERIDLAGIDTDDDGAADLNRRFWQAIGNTESFNSEALAEIEAEREEDQTP